MRIVVCIKPSKSEFVFPNELRNDTFVINPYDLCALKNCLELKKSTDCTIICICMGPLDAKIPLIKALAMGVDEVILLNDTAFSGSDTVATSFVLAKAIAKVSDVDMVVCGEKSVDGETGQVVYGISERLGYYCVCKAERFISAEDGKVLMDMDDERNLTRIEVCLPVVVAFRDFSLTYPEISLLALKRAKLKGVTVWNAEDIDVDTNKCGIKGSKTKVYSIRSGFAPREKNVVKGNTADKALFILGIVCGKKNVDKQITK